MSVPTEHEVRKAIHSLWREYPDGQSTFSQCSNGCDGQYARGGGECADCKERKLAELVGPDRALRVRQAIKEYRYAAQSAVDSVLEVAVLESPDKPTESGWGPWIEWGGGECPLPDDVKHEVRCESEVIDGAYNNASNWVWTHTMGGGNIVAYRIKKEDS